jgi:hypothetical protein
MNTDTDAVFEGLTRLVRVIGNDDALCERFCQLDNLSTIQRANEIYILVEQITAEQQDPELVALFRLFADDRIFAAAMVALRECGYLTHDC